MATSEIRVSLNDNSDEGNQGKDQREKLCRAAHVEF